MDCSKTIVSILFVSLFFFLTESECQESTSISDCLTLIENTPSIQTLDSCRQIGDILKNIDLISRSEYALAKEIYNDDLYGAFQYSAHAYKIRMGSNQLDSAFTLRCGYNAAYFAGRAKLPDSAYYYLNDIVESGIINETSVLARQDLGVYFSDRGNFPMAKAYIDQCLELQSELKPFQIFNLYIDHSYVSLDYAKVAYEDYRPILANKAISEAETYLNSIDIENIAKNDLSKYYQNLGWAHRYANNFDKSIEYSKRALALNIDPFVEADLFINLGVFYKLQSKYEMSISYLEKAIQKSIELDDNGKLYLAYDNYGETLLRMGLFEDAIDYFDRAICTVIQDYKNCEDLTINDLKAISGIPANRKIWLMIFLSDKARGYYNWYKKENQIKSLQVSLRYYVLADLMASNIRNAIPQESGQLAWRSKAKDIYEPAIEAAFEADSFDLVFRFMERSKSMMLQEALQRSNATDLLDQKSRNELFSNRAAVNTLETKLYTTEDQNSPESLKHRDTLLNLELRYVEFMNNLAETNPTYYQVIGREDDISLSEIQDQLEHDQVIISFFATQDDLIGAAIGKSKIEFKSISSRHQIDSLLSGFQDLMSQYDLLGSYTSDQYQDAILKLASYSNALYQVLIKPWSDLPENIVIIPSENLTEINFEGLLKDQPASEVPMEAWSYLIRDHNISYSPSIAIWLEMQGKQTSGRKVTTYTPDFTGSTFADLSETQSQINRRLPPFKVKNYSGPRANFENLGSYDGEAIIHLATHAVLNLDESEFSFLLLNNLQGGLDTIYLKDIYQIETPGAFLVVNACETSRGTSSRGEGVISLARAFTYAGASGLITSLWPVSDHVSAVVMKHFYENLEDGLQKDEALRQAKLAYLSNVKTEAAGHPYLWASLIHIGNNDPIVFSPLAYLDSWWIPIGILMLIVGMLWIKRTP